MEQEYGIGVKNRYALLLDDQDPFEIIKSVEAERLRKKAVKVQGENKENSKKADEGNKKAKGAPTATEGGKGAKGANVNITEGSNERYHNRKNREVHHDEQRNGEIARSHFRESGKSEGNEGGAGGPRGPPRGGPRGPRSERPFRESGRDRPQGGEGGDRPPRGGGRDRDRDRDRERRGGDLANSDPVDVTEGRPDRRPPPQSRRGPRPPGGPGRNYDTRGKREFDRKSGSDKTGVKPVDKRDGAGPYNWDNDKGELEAALNTTNFSDETLDWGDVPAATSPLKENENGANEGGEEGGAATAPAGGEATDEQASPPAPTEEEPKELTLDEYRALRGKRELPKFQIRKAGEGEDLSQWKNMYEIRKKTDPEATEEEEELEPGDYPQRVGRQRPVVGIDITFADSHRPGGGRGGRGGGPRSGPLGPRPDRGGGGNRGRFGGGRSEGEGGGRGGGTAARNQQPAPKVDDERDFPSLG